MSFFATVKAAASQAGAAASKAASAAAESAKKAYAELQKPPTVYTNNTNKTTKNLQ